MTYTSIFEKILLILNIISTSWMYIAFVSTAIILVILLGLKKISKKTCFILTTLATKIVLCYTIYIYYEPISTLINNIIDNIFLNIYFPSAYAYLFILVLTNIVTIAHLLKPRTEKIYKTINGICFIITNFTLVLILEIIAKEKIDIFSKESLFTNTTLITILEFAINIFIIWLISLITVYIINIVTEHIIVAKENKKLIHEPAIPINTELSLNELNLENEYQKQNTNNLPALSNPVKAILPEKKHKFIPDFTIDTKDLTEPTTNLVTINSNDPSKQSYQYNYIPYNNFDLSSFIPKKQDVKPISALDTNDVFEQIITNSLPVVKDQPKPILSLEETKDTYTLNDYRIFNKMLKDIREHNQSNSVTIDKNLEYRLITKYSTETYNMFKTMLKIYSN